MGWRFDIDDEEHECHDDERQPEPVHREDAQPIGCQSQAGHADEGGYPGTRMGKLDQQRLDAKCQQQEDNIGVDKQLQQLLNKRHGQVLLHGTGGVQNTRTVRHLDGEPVELTQQIIDIRGNEIHQVCIQGFAG